MFTTTKYSRDWPGPNCDLLNVMNRFLPIFLRTIEQPCLVVGGGDVALRKVTQLLRTGAAVHVVAPHLGAGLQALHGQDRITWEAGEFRPDSVQDYVLVIAATNDVNVNENVSIISKKHNIPVNVVDNPKLCTFIMPSIIDREPVQIAISTGGASPVLARLLRARLETLIPAAYGQLADLMQGFRDQVKARFPESRMRRRFWEKALGGPASELLFSGRISQARQILETLLEQGLDAGDHGGEVYLVGGGPGDPDLLTFRALRLMQQADVVLYDRLVSPAIVDLVRRDADRIYVGKERDRHALPQEQINQKLIELAREGKRVLRLKGGDPFIFGRGGEEIETLAAAGVPFQVVPGITAASGCASYAGIPLTHRDHAQSCIFVTGHMKEGELSLNWEALVQPLQTIAVYMGVKGIDVLCASLVKHGMAASMPAALVQQGTTPTQRVFISTLAELPGVVAANEIQPPSMVIIGEVVKLHEKLAWYKPGELKVESDK